MGQKGAFNPRVSKIRVHQELIGLVTKIEFIEQCDIKILNQCILKYSEPLCAKYCIFEAIKFKKGED
jgi:ethanolamine utilization protein EutP (predicted NTPase)